MNEPSPQATEILDRLRRDEPVPPEELRAVIDEVGALSPEDERVARLLQHTVDVPVLVEALEQQRAADAADTIEHLEHDERADVLVAMEEERAAHALAEMEQPIAEMVLRDLLVEDGAEYVARLLRRMAPDDAADVLQLLSPEEQEQIYPALPPVTAKKLKRLAGYGEETAAGLMTTEHHALRADMTVEDATEVIRASELPDEMHYLPVVDESMRLVGAVGLRQLLLTHEDRRIGNIMDKQVRAVRQELDQEEVAREFDRYDLNMLAVIDETDRLLGVITVDDVMDVIREEQTEDVQMTVGAGKGEGVYSGAGQKFRGRFPWLVTSLFMTCGAAIVVLFFEDLIRAEPILAFLMPVIAALVGNAGHQALAVTLRGIVLDEVHPGRVWPLVSREALVGLMNGVGLGILMFFVVWVISVFMASASWHVGAVAGAALMVSMCAGTLVGSGIPLLMKRLGADPAQSSAIFLIMITDGVSFTTFLMLAKLALAWMGEPSGA